MALIHCPECGREISDRAGKCPHCGYPLEEFPRLEYSSHLGNDTGPDPSDHTQTAHKDSFARRHRALCCLALVGIIAIGVLSFIFSADERHYKSALELYQQDQYEEALPLFTDLEEYKDSQELANACRDALLTEN